MLFPAKTALLLVAALTLTACGGLTPSTPPTAGADQVADQAAGASQLPAAKECPVIEPASCPPVEPPAAPLKPVIGEVEVIHVNPPGVRLSARIDTGATTTSVHAQAIERFERDGERWVRFELVDDDLRTHSLERKLERNVLIKQHGSDSVRRPVVKLLLSLAGVTHAVEVTLADRGEFEYNLLVGRNFLRDTYVVDVSQRYSRTEGPTP